MINPHKPKKYLILFLAVSFLFLFSACAYYSLVKADTNTGVGSAYNVKTPIKWSKAKINGVETWTIDGPQLQRVMFFDNVQSDKPLLKIKTAKNKNLPVYKDSMTSFEIMELVETTLSRAGGHHIVTKDLRPVNFGGLEGFRFEFNYQVKSGLKYSGFFVGAQKSKKLLAIMYLGTTLYHYQKNLDDAEYIVSSVTIH